MWSHQMVGVKLMTRPRFDPLWFARNFADCYAITMHQRQRIYRAGDGFLKTSCSRTRANSFKEYMMRTKLTRFWATPKGTPAHHGWGPQDTCELHACVKLENRQYSARSGESRWSSLKSMLSHANIPRMCNAAWWLHSSTARWILASRLSGPAREVGVAQTRGLATSVRQIM